MQFVWDDLIDRARVYVDDDHKEDGSWIKRDHWMTLFQIEYAARYRQWVRMGLVSVPFTETDFTGDTVTLNNVLCVVGVAENCGDYFRPLQPAQSAYGRASYWGGSLDTGKSVEWEASGAADTITLSLHPTDSSGNYRVRYISRPVYATDRTASVDLPPLCDEVLVLGACKRAHLKDATVSRALEDLLMKAEAELNFAAFGRVNGDSPRVRRIDKRPNYTSRFGAPYPTNPRFWMYF